MEIIDPGSSRPVVNAATDREAYPETSPQMLHHSSNSIAPAATAPTATDRTVTEEEYSTSLRHLSTAELCSLASSTATRYVQAVINNQASLSRNIFDESRTSEITTILLLARELQRRCTEPQTLQALCALTQAQLDLARTSIPQTMIPHYLVRVRRCVRVVADAVRIEN